MVANSAVGTVKLTVQQAKEGTREIEVESGDQLRAVLMAEKIDLYTTWGKVWQCGGVGQCGTCIVEVKSGGELLSERTAVEDKKLNGKPASWRLACQTLVGDGENSGEVTVATKPQ
ncbi:hypothetical protein HYH03_013988 [Edaphochlamys debaryana]|uniref:2Fe-2S ferredoxin-type domain-containing protein n=1 Tax=Edaphochlamys debaryana TaxID=47281 RepID=A0A836BSN1_9CHLO|nr:hypothetical protein HYH03_013988 [Edaphochlamys debaryana]|eukprot:KAG2487420.1 hypothetical protein HYH03_013988 [Edaphochlamys debaryana]